MNEDEQRYLEFLQREAQSSELLTELPEDVRIDVDPEDDDQSEA